MHLHLVGNFLEHSCVLQRIGQNSVFNLLQRSFGFIRDKYRVTLFFYSLDMKVGNTHNFQQYNHFNLLKLMLSRSFDDLRCHYRCYFCLNIYHGDLFEACVPDVSEKCRVAQMCNISNFLFLVVYQRLFSIPLIHRDNAEASYHPVCNLVCLQHVVRS